jgi:hypothetical protein
MPPAQWRCKCASRGGPHHSAYLRGGRCRTRGRSQPGRPPTTADSIPRHRPVPRPVLQAPLEEGDSLARTLELGLFKDVRFTVQPRVPNPQTGADLRRGDIKVHQGGTTWMLDIGVVCPGTQRYVDQGSQTTPGRAAEAYAAIKAAKYADQPNFVPFIVETGGYTNRRATSSWTPYGGLRGPAPPPTPDPGALQGTVTPRRRAQGEMQALVRIQAYMLADIIVAISAVLSTGCRVSSQNTHASQCLPIRKCCDIPVA